jgi:hypothetical protein
MGINENNYNYADKQLVLWHLLQFFPFDNLHAELLTIIIESTTARFTGLKFPSLYNEDSS